LGDAAAADAKSVVKGAAKVVASATVAFTFSHVLQKLSGQALWLPAELRVAVEVFATMIGTFVFLLAGKQPRAAAAQRRNLLKATAWTVVAVVFFVAYMWLRARCVVSWDPAEWREGKEPSDIEALPSAVDVQHGRIYIPLTFPPEQQDYLASLEREDPHGLDGLQILLQDEPDHLFDWLRGTLIKPLWMTSVYFLIVHLLIIVCVALGAAYGGARMGEVSAK
jgi:hypothetical protein